MLKLENLSKYYHNQNVVLGLRKINLEFKIGEFIAITGESGSGKSTLLNVISGMDSYEEGELYINGEETSYFDESDWEEYRKNSVGFIFQNFNLIDSYSVLENVEAAMIVQGIEHKERIKKAKEIIHKVGLSNRIKHRATKLSGGEKQRLAIARALAKNTKLIVADEPTGNLDSVSGKKILELLHEISKDKLVIIVTHNYEEVEPYVTRKIRLFDGEVVEDKTFILPNSTNSDKKIQEKDVALYKMALTFALHNIKAQPKKTFFMLLVTLATVFFVFIIYGAYSFNLDDNSRGYDRYEKYFNIYENRLLVTKKLDEDGNKVPLTNEDNNYFSGLDDVDFIIEYDLALDPYIYINISNDNEIYNSIGDLNLRDIRELTSDDLKAGRLPNNEKEVVIGNLYGYNYEELIKSINEKPHSISAFYDLPHLNQQMHLSDLKVVGIGKDDIDQGIYAGKEVFKSIWESAIMLRNIHKLEIHLSKDIMFFDITLMKDDSLTGNQIILPYYIQDMLTREGSKDTKLIIDGAEMEIVMLDELEYKYENAFVSNEVYSKLVNTSFYQYTLNLKNTKNVDDIIETLNNNGYFAFHPASIETYDQPYINVFTIIIQTIVPIFYLFVIYIFVYLIIKTILLTRKKDYTILRTIGINLSTIKKISLFEIVISFLSSYIIFLIIYFGFNFFNSEYLISILSSLEFKDYILILLINLLLSILITRRYNKLLIKKSLLINLRVGD